MMTQSFDDQLDALVGALPGEEGSALRAALERARPAVAQERSVLVASRQLVAVAEAAGRIERRGKPLVLGQLEPADLETFQPIEVIDLPSAPAYLAVDVDLGVEFRGITPEDALRRILAAGRSPLTLDEGVALMLQQPEVIARNWGFSLAGSRRGDQRVPALWVSEGRPKLGWCWDRNPHTWLGTASCARRIGPARPA